MVIVGLFVHIVAFLAEKEGGSLLILTIGKLHGSQSEKANANECASFYALMKLYPFSGQYDWLLLHA